MYAETYLINNFSYLRFKFCSMEIRCCASCSNFCRMNKRLSFNSPTLRTRKGKKNQMCEIKETYVVILHKKETVILCKEKPNIFSLNTGCSNEWTCFFFPFFWKV